MDFTLENSGITISKLKKKVAENKLIHQYGCVHHSLNRHPLHN